MPMPASVQIANRVIGSANSCPPDASLFGWFRAAAVVVAGFSPEVEVDDADAMFRQEKIAFTSLLPTLSAPYNGRFVAIHGGQVVDADTSRIALTKRFFKRFGDTHVYIGYVGRPEPVSYQVSPLKF